jgi:hypothetical protein
MRTPAHSSLPAAIRLSIAAGVIAAGLLAAAPVRAENSWEDGSPPPEDFGFQATAPQSGVSAYNWLYSTDGGTAVYVSWTAAGVDTSLLGSVSGGVATGMTTATASATRR